MLKHGTHTRIDEKKMHAMMFDNNFAIYIYLCFGCQMPDDVFLYYFRLSPWLWWFSNASPNLIKYFYIIVSNYRMTP